MVHLSSPIVLAFHGTRHPDGELTAQSIARAVSLELGGADVHVGWVDIHPRLLADQLPDLGPCTVVPCFIAAGYHVRSDVPAAAAASPHPVTVTPHLGASVDALLDAVADRVDEAGGPGDAVILAAIGSRFPEAQAEVEQAALLLETRLGAPVRAGFIFGGSPRVEDVTHALLGEGHASLVLAPYALAPGLFAERLTPLGFPIAAPIGAHPSLVSAVARLAAHAKPLGV